MGRKAAAKLQSPDVAAKTADAFRQQASLILEEHPELARFFELGGEDNNQAHHRAILQTIGLAFENLDNDPTGAARLRQHANDRGYSIGNSLMNLMPTPQELHQAEIHDFALKNGYQLKTGPGKGYEQQGPLVQRLMDSSTGTIEDRMGALDAYFAEAMPALDDKLNDLLTDYYMRKEGKIEEAGGQTLSSQPMDTSAYSEAKSRAQRVLSANDRSDDDVTQGPDSRSMTDDHERTIVIDSGGGDVHITGDIAGRPTPNNKKLKQNPKGMKL